MDSNNQSLNFIFSSNSTPQMPNLTSSSNLTPQMHNFTSSSNQSSQIYNFMPSASNPSSQMYNFMPMASFVVPNQPTQEAEEASRRSDLIQLLHQNLKNFWNQQLYQTQNTSAKFHQQLPLARVKRIMKSDGDVKMISADTPVLFSRACELFIMELTLRAWLHTEACKRRTLQRCDIARAIRNDDLLDFLIELVPLDDDDDDDHDHDYCHKEEDTEKDSVTESHSAALLRPVTNMGGESTEMNQVLHPFMMDQSMSTADFHHQFTSK